MWIMVLIKLGSNIDISKCLDMTKTIFQYHLLKNSFLEKTKNCSLQIPQNYSTLFELSTPEAKRSLGEQKVIKQTPLNF